MLTILKGEKPDQVPPGGLMTRVKRVRQLVDRYGRYEWDLNVHPFRLDRIEAIFPSRGDRSVAVSPAQDRGVDSSAHTLKTKRPGATH